MVKETGTVGNQVTYRDVIRSLWTANGRITGESVNICRAENYSEEHPIYLIKGLDAEGNAYEQEVDASKINPNHCSYNGTVNS